MTIKRLVLNNLITNATLASDIGSGDLTITLNSGGGAQLPTLGANEQTLICLAIPVADVVDDAVINTDFEVILIDSIAGDVLTVATGGRGYGSAVNGNGAAQSWLANTQVIDMVNAQMFKYLQDAYITAIADLNASLPTLISQADAEAGTDTTIKAWSSLRVRQAIVAYVTGGYAASLVANSGYIKLPTFLGGFVIQWATGDDISSGEGDLQQGILYPIAFPNEVLFVVPSLKVSGSGNISSCHFVSTTNTQCEVWVDTNASVNRTITPRIIAFGK